MYIHMYTGFVSLSLGQLGLKGTQTLRCLTHKYVHKLRCVRVLCTYTYKV